MHTHLHSKLEQINNSHSHLEAQDPIARPTPSITAAKVMEVTKGLGAMMSADADAHRGELIGEGTQLIRTLVLRLEMTLYVF